MHNTRLFYLLICFTLTTLSCKTPEEKTTPPNIIVFLVDDMGLMDTSVPFITDENGNPIKYPLNEYYRTPHMEELAKQGIRFTNFYAHSVCSPTRISIMTGQNSARHQVTTWIKPEENNKTEYGPDNWNWKGLDREYVTLPRLLQEAGYKTIHVGKAHFGPFGSDGEDPTNLGFAVNIGGSSIGLPGSYYGKDGFGHIAGIKTRAVGGLEKYHGQDIFLTEALTREAKKAITKANEEGKPFYLNMAHYAVHGPFQSDPRFADAYKGSDKSPVAQAFATMIAGVDKSLGDIMQHVKELGIGENTLIVFLGDNGSDAPLPMVDNYGSSTPLKGKKGNCWEGGMRVPFIASWIVPDNNMPIQKNVPIATNGVQQQMGTILDFFPTFCQLAGVTYPDSHVIDGYPLQDQLAGNENTSRKNQFINHFPHAHNSDYYSTMVMEGWKLIYHYQIDDEAKYELYNLKEDPFEANNLANDNVEKLKMMVKELEKELNAYQALPPIKDGQELSVLLPTNLSSG